MKRFFRWCLLGFLGLAILLAAAYALRGVLIGPWLARRVETAVEAGTGVRVAVGAVRGSYLAGIEVADVRTVEPATTGPLSSIGFRTLQITYSLPALLGGLDAFLAEAEIRLDGLRLAVDLGAGPGEGEGSEPGGPAAAVPLPGILPRVRVRDAVVEVRGPDAAMDLTGLSVDAEPRGSRESAVRLRADRLSWKHPALRPGETSLAADLLYSPEELRVKRVALGGEAVVAEAAVGLAELPAAAPVRADLRLLGGTVAVDGRFGGDLVTADWSAAGLRLGDLDAVMVLPDGGLGGTLDANGTIRLAPARPEALDGRVDLRVADLALRGATVEAVELRASAGEGTARVERLDVTAGANAASVRDLTAPTAALLAGAAETVAEQAKGQFSASLGDLPALLRMAGIEPPAGVERVREHRLTLEGALAGGTVTLSAGRFETAEGSVRLDGAEVALPVGGRDLDASPIRADLRIALPDLSSVADLLPIGPLAGALEGRVAVEGTLGTPRGEADLDGRGLAVRGFPVGDLTLRAIADAERVAVQSLALRRGPDRVAGEGRFEIPSRELRDVSLRATVADLGPYVRAFGPAGWSAGGRADATVSASGPVAAPRGSVRLAGEGVSLNGVDLGRLVLRASATGTKVVVDELAVRRGADRVSARGTLEIPGRRLDGVSLELSVTDLGAYAAAVGAGDADLTGRLKASASLSGPLLSPDGRVEASLEGARLDGLAVPEARLRATARGKEVRVETAAVRTAQGALAAAGTVTRGPEDASFEVALDALTVTRDEARLELQGPARLRLQPGRGRYAVSALTLAGEVGRIETEGVLALHGESDLRVALTGFTGAGWLEPLAGDRVSFQGADLTVRLTGSPGSPRVAAEGRVAKLGGAGIPSPFHGAFDAVYEDRVLAVRRFDWSADGGQRVSLSAKLPVDPTGEVLLAPGPVSLEASLDLPDLSWLGEVSERARGVAGALHAALHLEGTWREPSGTLRLTAEQVTLPPAVKPTPPGSLSVEVALSVAGREVSLESLRVEGEGLTADASGRWSGAPGLSDVLRGAGATLAGQVTLEARFAVPDLAWTAAAVPGVRRLGGAVEGEARVSGPIGEPDLEATVRLGDVEVRSEAAVPTVSGVNGRLALTATGARLEALRGELGGAPFRASGTASWEKGKGPRVDLAVEGRNLLLVRNAQLSLRADADLTVQGPVERLAIGGEVALTDGRFARVVDVLGLLQGSAPPPTAESGFHLFSFREPPLRDAVFDLKISAKSPFQIRTNVARGAARPDLRLTGTGEIPVLTGEVYLEPTTVRLPAGRLRFESGVIRFLESDPDRPRLDLQGRSQLLGYEVTVQVEGPYDEPVVTLSSVPPLPEEDLLLLVLTGQPPRTGASGATARQGGMNVAVYLGRGLLARWFGGDEGQANESVLDRFEVEIGRDVTRTGDETLDARFRLAEGVVRRGDTLYLTAEKDVFDDYNVGVKLVFRFR